MAGDKQVILTKRVIVNTTHGINPEFMDLQADPGKDFFRYANGAYVDQAVLPAGYSRWGTFLELRELSLDRLHTMMVEASQGTQQPGSIEQKMGDFFAAGMDVDAIEAQGASPLAGEFAAIARVRTRRGLARCVARLHGLGVGPLFGFGAMQSFSDSSQMVASIGQGGTSIGGRDYYVDTDDASIEKRRLYVQHISKMLQLLGQSTRTADRDARSIMAVETALAFAQMEEEEMRDPKNIDHVMSVAELRALTPSFDFRAYFRAIGAPDFKTLNVLQPDFFKALEKVLSKTSLRTMRAYLRWKLINSTAGYLSADFVNERFAFFGVVMSGLTEQQPRYKRVVNLVDSCLCEAIGQLYVERFFPPEAKTRVLEMIEDGKLEMRAALEKADWLSDETRSNLLAKIDKTVWKIGYPDKWLDFSPLTISRDSYVLNVLASNAFAQRLDLNKIGQPRDKSEWYMTPQTVNAYADPQSNEVAFPAAILQGRFFDFEADDAANYGAILVVILHEFGHLFDDSGANYDADGNVKMQWTEDDFARFMQRVQQIRTQFGRLTVGKNKVPVKGNLVSGEAAADLNGVNLAYRALMRRLEKTGRRVINGFTDEQRFFISFGQIWASICTPEYLESQVKGDPHPPEIFRVNATLANVNEFPAAFGLPDDCPIMLPVKERCHIW